MKYNNVYPFFVFDEIKKGKTVYVLDRKMKTVLIVNDMTVEDALLTLKEAEEDIGRFEFWVELKLAEEDNG